MRNTKPDPLSLVRDADFHQHVANLDQVRVGLSDLQAAPALNDEPAIQQELWRYTKFIRAAADFLFHLCEEGHQ